MTFQEFERLLKTVKPEATAKPHGALANGATKSSVAITFTPGGKVYDYRGSYASILERFGCEPQWYSYNMQGEIVFRAWTEEEAVEESEKWLAAYNEQAERNGWVNPWGSGEKIEPGQYRVRYWTISQLQSDCPFDPRTLF